MLSDLQDPESTWVEQKVFILVAKLLKYMTVLYQTFTDYEDTMS